MIKQHRIILLIIVASQFMCTSLWFAGNAVLPQLAVLMNLSASDLGWMTSSVQLGFIVGTIVYSFLTIADRFNPSKVFFASALLGAAANALIALPEIGFTTILVLRFLTGFFLAGIYPVGMKIASDYYEKGLGKAMSFLVGALVVGTAFPHLIASLDTAYDWRGVLLSTSGLAVLGGALIIGCVAEGPFRKKGVVPQFEEIKLVFKNPSFRSAAFGYFGHMWELYTFWAFVPVLLLVNSHELTQEEISLKSFIIIALGGVACFIGGFLAERFGTKRMATVFLTLSGFCCIITPFVMELNPILFSFFLIFWGLVVIADSPLFSTLVAQNANPALKGTALTLVTSIGFAITIVSIQLLSYLSMKYDSTFIYLVLVAGPVVGLLALSRKR